LTNGVRRYEDRWQSVVPMHLFGDRVIDSSVVGIRKPQHEIFHLADQNWGFKPEETVFIDDYLSNVLAATAAVGWRGIHHTDTQVTIAQVAELTGLDLTLPVQRWSPPEAAAATPVASYRERVTVVRDRIEDLIAWRPQTPIDPPLQPRVNAMRNSAPRAGLDRVATGIRHTHEHTSNAVKDAVENAVSAGTKALAAGLDRLHEALKPEDASTYASGMGWKPLQLSVDDSPSVED
jgi:hypothetical protein